MPLAQVDGSLIAPTVEILSGGIRFGGIGYEPSSQQAVATTYFYRVLATGVRSSTTNLGSIPANSVIEGISTT